MGELVLIAAFGVFAGLGLASWSAERTRPAPSPASPVAEPVSKPVADPVSKQAAGTDHDEERIAARPRESLGSGSKAPATQAHEVSQAPTLPPSASGTKVAPGADLGVELRDRPGQRSAPAAASPSPVPPPPQRPVVTIRKPVVTIRPSSSPAPRTVAARPSAPPARPHREQRHAPQPPAAEAAGRRPAVSGSRIGLAGVSGPPSGGPGGPGPTAPAVKKGASAVGQAQNSPFKLGRVAYLRCVGVEQEQGRYPCPRDKPLELRAGAVLRDLATCSAAQGLKGTGDVRLRFRRGRQWPEVLWARVSGTNLPAGPLETCVGPRLRSLRTRLSAKHLLISIRFTLK